MCRWQDELTASFLSNRMAWWCWVLRIGSERSMSPLSSTNPSSTRCVLASLSDASWMSVRAWDFKDDWVGMTEEGSFPSTQHWIAWSITTTQIWVCFFFCVCLGFLKSQYCVLNVTDFPLKSWSLTTLSLSLSFTVKSLYWPGILVYKYLCEVGILISAKHFYSKETVCQS